MSQFRHTKTDVLPTNSQVADGHPAFRLGAIIATQLTDYEHKVANMLNRSQHRIGFQVRNGLLAITGLGFLLYFIALLT